MSEPVTSPVATATNTPATPDFTTLGMAGIKKVAAPKTHVVRAAQLKPCAVRYTDKGEERIAHQQLVYVTHDGQQVKQDCTPQLFGAVEDQRLDQIDNSDFLIHVTSPDKLAVRVEPIARQDFSFGLVPTDLEGVKLVAFLVNVTNGFATIKQYPAKFDRETLIEMKRELDGLTAVTVGQRLLNRFPIVDVREGVGDCTVFVDPKGR
jgi:hypothetical protein